MELINIISQYLQENGINHKIVTLARSPDYIYILNSAKLTSDGEANPSSSFGLLIMQEQSQPNRFYITGGPDQPKHYNLADPEALPKLLQDIRISLTITPVTPRTYWYCICMGFPSGKSNIPPEV